MDSTTAHVKSHSNLQFVFTRINKTDSKNNLSEYIQTSRNDPQKGKILSESAFWEAFATR